jgi:dTDP-4-amino-4,6-dideoxygalactose transaminase
MTLSTARRHSSRTVAFESYDLFGFNYRMTDIQAAIGREQLQRLPEIIALRRALAERYFSMLSDVPGLVLPEEPSWARSNWQSFCVRLPEGLSQREVMQSMLDGGVSTRRGIMCAHREPVYGQQPWSCGAGPRTCSCPPGSCERLVESERAQDRCIVLPLYPQMTRSQQDHVVEALKEACVARV